MYVPDTFASDVMDWVNDNLERDEGGIGWRWPKGSESRLQNFLLTNLRDENPEDVVTIATAERSTP